MSYAQFDAQANREKLKEFVKDSAKADVSADKSGEFIKDTDVIPEFPGKAGMDPATYQAYQQSLQKYYEYRIHGFTHRQRIFEWQYASSKIIFIIVLVLVLAGIYFAAVQFHTGLKYAKKKALPEEATEFVFSWKSIQVKSPVLGVIILVISLVFFYLYLVYVYPIENVF
jgi:predicted membrane protein